MYMQNPNQNMQPAQQNLFNTQQPMPEGVYQNTPQGPQQIQPQTMQQKEPTYQQHGVVVEMAYVGNGVTKNNIPWQRYKLKIDGQTDGLHTYNLFVSPQGKIQQPPQLGEYVRFGYVLQPNPNTPHNPIRKIIWLNKSNQTPPQQLQNRAMQAQQYQQPMQQPMQNTTPQQPVQADGFVIPKPIGEFVQIYRNAVQNTNTKPSLNHFVGTYYVNFSHDELTKELMETFKKEFENQPDQPKL